ncbi:MAG: hypothetical protein ABIN91_09565 [Mucilaginibacter sp.]|uniref:hypothetical protein n=1 Tax=Mucilaginibacter sp. TaxID=1882438 RepID=UPI003267C0E3
MHFLTSAVVPAAQGSAKITKDANNNYAVHVKIKNLAEPDRLQPKKSVYVVWLVTKDQNIKNLGQLKSSSGFFSSVLEGELETVTPFYPTRIFITAEDEPNVQRPGNNNILTTKASD